ncbi:MAG: hypothetical protein A4E64_01345 [Syntrophorhabdus sp. PtaU1.Bin058]|nr:MAG: hypothetical protein A4E64_01345 [Syntrophorhabdus sp. PtaU1.Bin058]
MNRAVRLRVIDLRWLRGLPHTGNPSQPAAIDRQSKTVVEGIQSAYSSATDMRTMLLSFAFIVKRQRLRTLIIGKFS